MFQTDTAIARAMGEVDAFNHILTSDLPSFLRKTFEELEGFGFQDAWHLFAMAHVLEEVRLGRVLRQIINIQPRSLKSMLVSVAWVAWCLGHDPSLKFMCVSYSQELSLAFARQCRQVMLSPWYRAAFPGTVLTRLAEHDLQTSAGGGRFSTSVGGPVTGFGADIIILDDPQNAADAASQAERARVIAFWRNSLSTRLNNKLTGRVVMVAQRLHQDDLTGHLLDSGGFDLLRLPSITSEDVAVPIGGGRVHHWIAGGLLQPAREPIGVLDEQRRTLGSAAFAAQYLQDPVPADGSVIKRDWIKGYDRDPGGGQIYLSIDAAGKAGLHNDYSAFVIGRVLGRDVYILKVDRARLNYPELKARTIALCREYGVQRLLIEDASNGQSLIQDLCCERPSGVVTPIALKVDKDKRTRMEHASGSIEQGHFHLPHEAPWLGDLETELLGFPNARYDDIADAVAHLMIDTSTNYMPGAGVITLDRQNPYLNHGSMDGCFVRDDGAIDFTHEATGLVTYWGGIRVSPKPSQRDEDLKNWQWTPG